MIAWYGGLKFMNYEAEGVRPWCRPVRSWAGFTTSSRCYTFSALLGVFELAAAALLAVKPWWPRISLFGSLLAIMLFLATLSFMVTTPGVFEAPRVGSPPWRWRAGS